MVLFMNGKRPADVGGLVLEQAHPARVGESEGIAVARQEVEGAAVDEQPLDGVLVEADAPRDVAERLRPILQQLEDAELVRVEQRLRVHVAPHDSEYPFGQLSRILRVAHEASFPRLGRLTEPRERFQPPSQTGAPDSFIASKLLVRLVFPPDLHGMIGQTLAHYGLLEKLGQRRVGERLRKELSSNPERLTRHEPKSKVPDSGLARAVLREASRLEVSERALVPVPGATSTSARPNVLAT